MAYSKFAEASWQRFHDKVVESLDDILSDNNLDIINDEQYGNLYDAVRQEWITNENVNDVIIVDIDYSAKDGFVQLIDVDEDFVVNFVDEMITVW